MEFGIRILVVDDEPLVLGLLTDLLSRLGHEVVGAQNAAEARVAANRFDPDVGVIDVDLGTGPSGIDLAIALQQITPGLGILFLSNLPDPKLAGYSSRLPSGSGYLLKSNVQDTKALIAAIRSVATGKAPQQNQQEHLLSRLSRTQLDVVRLVAQGKSNEEIAQIRGTTVRAVRQTLARAARELGLEEDAGPEKRVQTALAYLKVAGLPK